jgi:hypothetical protein
MESVVNFHRPLRGGELIPKKTMETVVSAGIFYDSEDEDDLYK